jgi:hypothetical protein
MKKFLFLALTISVIGSANAQTNSILVYGDGGYSSSGQYSVSTGIGYQFNKNWTAGGTFGVARLSPGGAPSLFTTHSVGGFYDTPKTLVMRTGFSGTHISMQDTSPA